MGTNHCIAGIVGPVRRCTLTAFEGLTGQEKETPPHESVGLPQCHHQETGYVLEDTEYDWHGSGTDL